ncbi:MAG TPA: putative glycoside hydrolase [Chthonomonadaceae bacterium]|nr:putative glycoside hydrolase [Chthonomonadaceae bacterium]
MGLMGLGALVALPLVGCNHNGANTNASALAQNGPPPAPPKPPGPPPPPALPEGGVKGIYLTGWSAGTKRFDQLVALVDRTELNAMVIDAKDDGNVYFDTDIPLARTTPGVQKHAYKPEKIMPILEQHHIYSIARIACFRDTPMATAHPDMAVQDAQGRVWHDKSGHAWLNPYNKANWDYNIAIGMEAIKRGFKEVQFDYVRFPSEGNISLLHYPGKKEGDLRKDQISAFLKYAREKFKAQGVYFSADVFGLTSKVNAKNPDMGIGQTRTNVAEQVDFLSPMVYPSHYAYGEYGMKDPNKEPYKTVTLSVGDAQKNLKAVPTCKLRPWIQDFDLRHVHYGPTEVRAQIKALSDLGITEFLLWNARNVYTEDALEKEKQPAAAAVGMSAPAPKSSGSN